MNEHKEIQDPLFIPAPFFMIRTPLLPVEESFHMCASSDFNHSILSTYDREDMIREAIAVASPSLHTALKNGKRGKDQISSLVKYLLRMSTRSTPFGLFAFVSLGSWSQKTLMNFDLSKIKKRARPDMEWLFALIDQVTANANFFLNLRVQTNPLIFALGDRTYLSHLRNKEAEKEKKVISIRSNFLTETIFDIAQKPMIVQDIEDKILEKYPSLPRVKVQEMIKTLLDQQFLLYDLFPSLLTESPFGDLLSKLSHIMGFDFSSLFEISHEIENYNQTSLGQGEHFIAQLEEKMKKWISTSHYLQVDSFYEEKNLHLSHAIIKELQESTEVLWRLSFRNFETSPLRSYYNKFINKYGMERLVPIKELLHEEAGLGIPENYTNSIPTQQESSNKQENWKKWLKRELANALYERKKEIMITDEIINRWAQQRDKEQAPLSFDLFCEIIADSSLDIDEGNFHIHILSNTHHGGNTFGRFLDLFGKRGKELLQILFLKEEELEKNSLFVESSYLPFSSRLANVAIHPNLRKYAIDLSPAEPKPETIVIEDIYVGANHERLYLFSKKENKELIIKTGNVLNPMMAPALLRFLRDVSDGKNSSMISSLWFDLEDSPFLPRLTYKKTILSAAKWRVNLSQIGAFEKDKEEIIGQRFLDWAMKWELPPYVFMTSGDNRILLNWRHIAHLNEIVTNLKKGEEVLLVEKIGSEKGGWIKNESGKAFVSEFVIPFIKNKTYSSKKSIFPLTMTSVESKDRWKLPGSEWLYVKFYLGKENSPRFVINHLWPFVNVFKEQGIIIEWFFIYYNDPDPHVRVRFRGKNETLLSQFLPSLHDWAFSLIHHRQIKYMQLDTYEREVERYGGTELIDLAESFFCADSDVSLSLTHLIVGKKTILPPYAIAALSLLDLMKGFGLNLKEQLNFFSAMELDKAELKGFRQWKSDLLSLSNTIIDDNGLDLCKKQEAIVLHEIWGKRKKAQIEYRTKIFELKDKEKLCTPLVAIQNSILHMHCNRLMQTESILEKKARLYAYHTLATIDRTKR